MGFKHCWKCDKETDHRLVKDKTSTYYHCKVCLENNCRRHRKKHWPRYLAQKANARQREGSIPLTGEHVQEQFLKQESKCALTGLDLNIEDKWWRPSLDRIDSSKGYTLDNIRIVAWIVNHCRGKLNDQEFIDMCKKVSKFNQV